MNINSASGRESLMADRKIIVVVDDDESIRKTFFLILHKEYRVYLARDAGEALKRFNGSHVDLVIADLGLQDGGGIELISEFRKAGYKGKAILISACPDSVRADSLERLSIAYLLTKPLDLNALDESIHSLLKYS